MRIESTDSHDSMIVKKYPQHTTVMERTENSQPKAGVLMVMELSGSYRHITRYKLQS